MRPNTKIVEQLSQGPQTILTLARHMGQSTAVLKPKLDALLEDGRVVIDHRGFYSKPGSGGPDVERLPDAMKGRTCVFCGFRDAILLAKDEGVMKPGCGTCVKPKVSKLPPKKVDTEAFMASVQRAVRQLQFEDEPVRAESVCRAMGLETDDTNMVKISRCLAKHFKADVTPVEAMRCSA